MERVRQMAAVIGCILVAGCLTVPSTMPGDAPSVPALRFLPENGTVALTDSGVLAVAPPTAWLFDLEDLETTASDNEAAGPTESVRTLWAGDDASFVLDVHPGEFAGSRQPLLSLMADAHWQRVPIPVDQQSEQISDVALEPGHPPVVVVHEAQVPWRASLLVYERPEWTRVPIEALPGSRSSVTWTGQGLTLCTTTAEGLVVLENFFGERSRFLIDESQRPYDCELSRDGGAVVFAALPVRGQDADGSAVSAVTRVLGEETFQWATAPQWTVRDSDVTYWRRPVVDQAPDGLLLLAYDGSAVPEERTELVLLLESGEHRLAAFPYESADMREMDGLKVIAGEAGGRSSVRFVAEP